MFPDYKYLTYKVVDDKTYLLPNVKERALRLDLSGIYGS